MLVHCVTRIGILPNERAVTQIWYDYFCDVVSELESSLQFSHGGGSRNRIMHCRQCEVVCLVSLLVEEIRESGTVDLLEKMAL